ncbi:hypothetical protein [Rhodococcus sp. KBS0724]|nr:hypothetical protein [Rhodococcus sp. KBS0724]
MTTSPSPAIPRHPAPSGAMSTEEIKARIEVMFADRPADKSRTR